ncbi:hypothetical protein HC928_04615 [bacterium]|nr:hypothetical protein [bacterium]
MEISTERFDDSSLPDEGGQYEYRYTGVVYTFVASNQQLVFRRYDDEPSIATLLRPSDWHADLLRADLFLEAVEYLRREGGVTTIKAYNRMKGTYSPINSSGEQAT